MSYIKSVALVKLKCRDHAKHRFCALPGYRQKSVLSFMHYALGDKLSSSF